MRVAALLLLVLLLFGVFALQQNASTTAAAPAAPPVPVRRNVLNETVALRGPADWRSWHLELKEPATMEVKIDSAEPVDVLISDVPAGRNLMESAFTDLPCSRSAVLSASIRCDIPATALDRTLIIRDSRTSQEAAASALVGAVTRDSAAVRSATSQNRVRVSWAVIPGASRD